MDPSALIHHLNATSRVLGTREIDGETAHVVQATRIYDASPEEVWAALTDAERIPRWLGPISGELRLGGRFQLQGNAGGEILRCEPPREVGVTWEMGEARSWVDVTLTPEAGGTRLVLEHAALPSEHWARFGAGATGVGWDLALFGLDRLLAQAPVDAAEFMAWSMTDAGKDATRRSARAWVLASVAGGTAPALAEARGLRTAAFYTGEAPPEGT